MSRQSHEIFLPGLLGPWPTTFRPLFKQLFASKPTIYNTTNTLLSSRSPQSPASDIDAEIFTRFLPQSPTPPHAQVRWQVDKQLIPSKKNTLPAFCADPVSMQAEMHGARVHDSNILQLSDHEAQQLSTDFNATFGDDGYHWALINNRGYLFLTETVDLQTQSLADATSSDILEWGFAGKDSSLYQKYATEWQMWLYQHPINQARQQQKLPAISAIWLWGEGQLPTVNTCNYQQIINGSEYSPPIALQGLAEHFSVPIVSSNALDSLSQKNTFIIDESLSYPAQALEPEQWFSALEGIFNEVLQPLITQKANFAITVPNQYRFVGNHGFLKFFKRSQNGDIISASEWR
jgi:hypothetical protein